MIRQHQQVGKKNTVYMLIKYNKRVNMKIKSISEVSLMIYGVVV